MMVQSWEWRGILYTERGVKIRENEQASSRRSFQYGSAGSSSLNDFSPILTGQTYNRRWRFQGSLVPMRKCG
jgi:hypothetical protein